MVLLATLNISQQKTQTQNKQKENKKAKKKYKKQLQRTIIVEDHGKSEQ